MEKKSHIVGEKSLRSWLDIFMHILWDVARTAQILGEFNLQYIEIAIT